MYKLARIVMVKKLSTYKKKLHCGAYKKYNKKDLLKDRNSNKYMYIYTSKFISTVYN